jgi:hypothetical protein
MRVSHPQAPDLICSESGGLEIRRSTWKMTAICSLAAFKLENKIKKNRIFQPMLPRVLITEYYSSTLKSQRDRYQVPKG